MDKARLKNDGFHDILVEADRDDISGVVFIRQHGRHPSAIVVAPSVVPLLIEALQEVARG